MNQARQVSSFDDSEICWRLRLPTSNTYGHVNPQGGLVASLPPSRAAPYNWTWSLEADRELLPRVMLRLSYISSRAFDQYIVDPE
jgi:hypothetical protein